MAVSVLWVVFVLGLVYIDSVVAGEVSYSNGSGHHNEEIQGYTNAVLNATYVDRTGIVKTIIQGEHGRFGNGHISSASGWVVHLGKNGAGCSSTINQDLPQEPWIALVERGGCHDDRKVENAFENNAVAVVLYQHGKSGKLDKMDLDEQRNISSVLISRDHGDKLVRIVENGTKVFLTITVGTFVQKHYTNINRTSVLFVSISFIVLMIISLAWLVFYYVQRFRYIHAKDRLSRRLCSAAKKALSKIPTKNIKSEDKEMQGDGECCAVCIEPYKVSDVLRILPCKHEFHKSCIDPWLLEHRTCPMCKMDILKHYGFVFTGSQESILHMDIEEVVGLGTPGPHNTDTLQRRSISPMPHHIRSVEHQSSSPTSPELQSHSSRASSPDEMTPSLPSNKRLVRAEQSSADPVPCVLVCSSCGSDMTARPEPSTSMNNDTVDCDIESCSSSISSSPCQSRAHGKH